MFIAHCKLQKLDPNNREPITSSDVSYGVIDHSAHELIKRVVRLQLQTNRLNPDDPMQITLISVSEIPRSVLTEDVLKLGIVHLTLEFLDKQREEIRERFYTKVEQKAPELPPVYTPQLNPLAGYTVVADQNVKAMPINQEDLKVEVPVRIPSMLEASFTVKDAETVAGIIESIRDVGDIYDKVEVEIPDTDLAAEPEPIAVENEVVEKDDFVLERIQDFALCDMPDDTYEEIVKHFKDQGIDVVCDATNNPPSVLDNKWMVIDHHPSNTRYIIKQDGIDIEYISSYKGARVYRFIPYPVKQGEER